MDPKGSWESTGAYRQLLLIVTHQITEIKTNKQKPNGFC